MFWLEKVKDQMINDKKLVPAYDFPLSGEPGLRYLICSTPRTGSTMMSRLLANTGLAGRPEEYLRHDRIKLWSERLGFSRKPLNEYLSEIEKRRTSPNGVFGIKVHYRDVVRLFKSAATQGPGLAWLNHYDKVIFFRRRDKLAQAISFYRAVESNIWSVEKGGERAIQASRSMDHFSPVKLAHFLSGLIVEDECWLDLLNTLPNGYTEIWYEDLLADVDGTVRTVLATLGVSLDGDSSVEPETLRQTNEENALMREKFREYCIGAW